MMLRVLATCALGLLCAAPAQAAVITFEGHFNTLYWSSIVREGFVIGNAPGEEQHFHEITSTWFGLPSNGTGVLLNDRDTTIVVKEQGGASFALSSVDVASALNNNPAVGLQLRGYLGATLVGQITVGTLGTGYTTLAGGPLGNVDRLVFDGFGGGGGFIIDNLALNESAVPEPATLALLAFGLALSRRRFLPRRT